MHPRAFRWKRGTLIALLLAAVCLFAGSTARAAQPAPLRVVVLTDVAGLGDKGFNDACWQGILRAGKDFGIKHQFMQSREQADYVPNLTLAARRADVVVTLGFLFCDAVKQVAKEFPKVRFIHMEGDIPGENVASFDFKSEEGGFLAGLVAGFYSKSFKVGVVAGMDIPPVEAYVAGFRAGVKTAEKVKGREIETVVAYAGSFNDPVKGKSLARAMMDRGVDVVFKAAGNTGIGALEAVKATPGVTLIGDDIDQDAEIPGRVLTSTLKRMDEAAYMAIRDVVQGTFKGGHRWLGEAEGGMDITDMKYTRGLFAPADFEMIQKARTMLKEAKFGVPKLQEDLDSFTPPAL